MGGDIPDKPRVFMRYLGGVGNDRQRCNEVAAKGWSVIEPCRWAIRDGGAARFVQPESTGDQIVHEKRACEIGPATRDHEVRRASLSASGKPVSESGFVCGRRRDGHTDFGGLLLHADHQPSAM